MRDWLRTRTALLGELSNDTRRIDLDAPSGTKKYIVLFRDGGSPDRNVPLDLATITFHCYGPALGAAVALQLALIDELSSMSSEPLNDSVYGRGADILSSYYLPDGTTPRYVVTALVTASRRSR